MDGILAAHGTDFQPLIEVSLLSTAVALASEGLGYAILPAFLIPQRLRDGLSVVRLTDPVIERPLSLFSRRGRILSPAAERFHELVSKDIDAFAMS
jgi:DNA-binding transcriptional LysR family regulator